MTEIHKKCGCRIFVNVERPEFSSIEYCSMHNAAPALDKALRNAKYAVWYMAKHGIDAYMIDWEKRFNEVEAALALAVGKDAESIAEKAANELIEWRQEIAARQNEEE